MYTCNREERIVYKPRSQSAFDWRRASSAFNRASLAPISRGKTFRPVLRGVSSFERDRTQRQFSYSRFFIADSRPNQRSHREIAAFLRRWSRTQFRELAAAPMGLLDDAAATGMGSNNRMGLVSDSLCMMKNTVVPSCSS